MITAMAKDTLVTHFLDHWKKWLTVILIAAPMAVVVAVFNHRDDIAVWAGYATTVTGAAMVPNDGGISPGARLFRDFMVLFIAVIGIVLAIVRAIYLHIQAETARGQFELANSQFQHQTDAATKQFNQAESRMFNEQFATAAELMAKDIAGKPAIAARVSGIHAMGELVNADSQAFLLQTAKIMVAYIKDNAQMTATPRLREGEIPEAPRFLGEDVKAAFAVVDSLLVTDAKGRRSEALLPDILDFSHANFSHLDLRDRDLSRFKWDNADLSGANLYQANLEGASLRATILHGADLSDAFLGGASLPYAQLQGAKLNRTLLCKQDTDQFTQRPDTVWHGANLKWASVVRAHLNVMDWSVYCLSTNFSDAIVNSHLTERDTDLLMSKIWHSQTPAFANIPEQDKDTWHLEECCRTSTSALFGAFKNFANMGNDLFVVPQAISFRKAAVKLLSDNKLPPDFPQSARQWLEEIRDEPNYGAVFQSEPSDES